MDVLIHGFITFRIRGRAFYEQIGNAASSRSSIRIFIDVELLSSETAPRPHSPLCALRAMYISAWKVRASNYSPARCTVGGDEDRWHTAPRAYAALAPWMALPTSSSPSANVRRRMSGRGASMTGSKNDTTFCQVEGRSIGKI